MNAPDFQLAGRRLGIAGRVGALSLLLLACPGCLAVGALIHTVYGPAPVDAKFVPANVPTLVLVENYRNPSISELDANQIARMIGDHLTENKAVKVIDPEIVSTLRENDPGKFHGMSIPAVGAAAGAEQVIYVDLLASDVTADPSRSAAHAQALARVRIVKVSTGDTVWPAAAEGYEVAADVPYSNQDEATMSKMRIKMLDSLSDSIAKLFYQWKPDTEQESNES